jgi:hypothetical protein
MILSVLKGVLRLRNVLHPSLYFYVVLMKMPTNAQQYFDAVRSDQLRCLQSVPFVWMVIDCMLLLYKSPVMP